MSPALSALKHNFENKRIAVIGMARSGLAAADVLTTRGAQVALYDAKPAGELGDALAFAAGRGIEAHPETNEVGRNTELVVTSPGVRRSANILTDAQQRGIPIWGEIEAAYRIARVPILAITGTNGKTTTTALLGEMARRHGVETFVAGNIAAGDIAMPLIRAADQAVSGNVIVAEISSFQLEWIDAFQPLVAAITNISADHSDRQTWDEYVASKWRIAENQGRGDTTVLRSDVPTPGESHVGSGQSIVYFDQLPRPSWLPQVALPGEHNRENVMAAFAMGWAFGLSEEAMRDAALSFQGVVHRLEFVAEVAGTRWINNSMCTNNDAFVRSVAAIDGLKVVLAGGVYKGGDTREIADALAAPSVRATIFFGKSAALLDEAARKGGVENTEVVEALRDAAERARVIARPGDTVLLSPACASFDQFRDFEDRGDQFKAIVREFAAE